MSKAERSGPIDSRNVLSSSLRDVRYLDFTSQTLIIDIFGFGGWRKPTARHVNFVETEKLDSTLHSPGYTGIRQEPTYVAHGRYQSSLSGSNIVHLTREDNGSAVGYAIEPQALTSIPSWGSRSYSNSCLLDRFRSHRPTKPGLYVHPYHPS